VSAQSAGSDLLEIAKRNGDFRKNYGTIIGAYLYLRSINAAGGLSLFWSGLFFTAVTAGLNWLQRHG
jgi:hypothetical protein